MQDQHLENKNRNSIFTLGFTDWPLTQIKTHGLIYMQL